MFPLFSLAEKSGYGHEEGWCQGSNYDDLVFASSVYYSICFGLLHLSYIREQPVLFIHREAPVLC